MFYFIMEIFGGGLSYEMEEEVKSKDGSNGENWFDVEKFLERGVVLY